MHECGHFLDLAHSTGSDNVFIVGPELELACSGGSVTDWGGQTFSRNRINDDEFSALRPPCGGPPGPDCDGWADVYLDGDPGRWHRPRR